MTQPDIQMDPCWSRTHRTHRRDIDMVESITGESVIGVSAAGDSTTDESIGIGTASSLADPLTTGSGVGVIEGCTGSCE